MGFECDHCGRHFPKSVLVNMNYGHKQIDGGIVWFVLIKFMTKWVIVMNVMNNILNHTCMSMRWINQPFVKGV
jgi:hypothetical protein